MREEPCTKKGEYDAYEFKFVKIDLEGFLVATKKPKENHHRVVEQYSKDGLQLARQGWWRPNHIG
jgi:hypothetical protein